jgi:hypothetical protein
VHTELEELNQIAAQLDRMERLLPALNTDTYLKHRDTYRNLQLLNTSSQVEESLAQKIAVKGEEDNEPLINVRSQHRRAINELAELNGQIISNLSAKMQALQNRKLKETGV